MAAYRVVLALALWLNGAAAFGQFISSGVQTRTPPSTARHEFSGTVVNSATGEPLRKALVSLQTPEGQQAAFTDPSGHFSIENVPDGQYAVQCQKPGFFPANQQASRYVRFMITVSGASPAATLLLAPAASIVGRVLDEQGQPVESATLQVYSTILWNGRKRLVAMNGANTDEDGNYEIGSLQPGTYRLQLNMRVVPRFAVASRAAQAKLPDEVYPAQYYPQSSDASGAQPLILKAGQTEHADFTVKPVPAFSIGGTISPVKLGAFVRVEDASGIPVNGGVQVNPQTGRWVIPALPAGTWKILAQSQEQQEQVYAEQTVSIEGSDVANLPLQLMPSVTIPVEIQNAGTGSGSGISVQLFPATESEYWQQNERQASPAANSQPTEDGQQPSRLQFPDVRPGGYRLSVQSSGANCLDSVHSQGNDIAREGITVTPGQAPSPIEVTLRSDCASLQVKLNSEGPGKSASVLLLPDVPTIDPIVRNDDSASAAHFSSLSPGPYHVYAFSDTSTLEYANPEAMRSFAGKEVTLAPNQRAEITLDVIKLGADAEHAQ